MFPKRTKTFHSAILLAYVALSFLGGPIHHWTHHATCSGGACSSALCHATPTLQTGAQLDTCDDLSTPSSRHCCCNHDNPTSRSCPKQTWELQKIALPELGPSDAASSVASSSDSRVRQIKARSQDCEICSQLARLNHSWATSDPVAPTTAEVAAPLIERTCCGPFRTSIDPRSRAPPSFQCS